MRKPTSPNKLYIKLRPNFMSTREDRETSTTKRRYGYYHHHFGIFAK